MEIVSCTENHWPFVLALRNDLKEGFIDQQSIHPAAHQRFMTKHWEHYFVCVEGGEPLGFIGIVDGDIRVAVGVDFQGRGVGKFMLEWLISKHPKGVAKIKSDNIASLKLFESCGFVKKFYILENE